MKQTKNVITCLMAVVLMTMVAAITASAATPTLQGRIVLRPVTPGDVTNYKLASTTEVSGGLHTVGVGTPIYLEAEVNIAIPASNIVSVTWVLTNKPIGSVAAFTSSPLGTNVPVYEPSDRTLFQVARVNGRTLLRPDMVGQYTVVVSIVSSSYGSTNVTQTITAGTYMGLNTCALCHSGGVIAEDKFTTWQTTAHSTIFSNGINGYLGSYSASCLKCHTVGWDTTATATNGGFDDIMTQTGWTFPTVLTNSNWAAMPAALRNVGNIQCENCHGPGSQHAFSLGDTNLITKTIKSGDCNQCHDAPTHHVKGTEWYVSRHALTTGPSSVNCLPCHSADGFIARGASATNANYALIATPNATFAPISCQACHEPHGETVPAGNPHLIRALGAVTMPGGTVVTNAGEGAVCLECHQNRNGSATNQLVNYPIGRSTWFGGSSFGAHDNPQGDMIEGINAHTYGQSIPSSAHRVAVTNLCVGCHMQTVAATDPAFLKAGGHTFNMIYSVVTTNAGVLVTNSYDKVDVCVQCHGPIDSFDMVRGDYNGDGVIEGVQTEVQHMLDKLSTLLPNGTYRADGNYVADGLVKSSISVKTNWPAKFLKGAYNWQFVNNDGSKGVHNAPFAVGLLKASIGDLTGDANNDGLPDAWQIQYFGSANNPAAAPNAMPAGDGVPNWVRYTLGLNPLLPGISVTNGLSVGVVWADGNSLVNPFGSTNTIQIYTAAEVAFDTLVGRTYQIQAASSLSSGWQNVGYPIQGTGHAVSYVTPTRQDVKQFYRVYSY
jgi:Doubled CXXCH motif (Paired_CXXCH_1)